MVGVGEREGLWGAATREGVATGEGVATLEGVVTCWGVVCCGGVATRSGEAVLGMRRAWLSNNSANSCEPDKEINRIVCLCHIKQT